MKREDIKNYIKEIILQEATTTATSEGGDGYNSKYPFAKDTNTKRHAKKMNQKNQNSANDSELVLNYKNESKDNKIKFTKNDVDKIKKYIKVPYINSGLSFDKNLFIKISFDSKMSWAIFENSRYITFLYDGNILKSINQSIDQKFKSVKVDSIDKVIKKINEFIKKEKLTNENNKINEITYKDFKNDDSKTNKSKINDSIKHIYSEMTKLNKLIDHTVRLHNETDGNPESYRKDTRKKLVKLNEKLVIMSNKLKGI